LISTGVRKLPVGRAVGTCVGAVDITIEWLGCGEREVQFRRLKITHEIPTKKTTAAILYFRSLNFKSPAMLATFAFPILARSL